MPNPTRLVAVPAAKGRGVAAGGAQQRREPARWTPAKREEAGDREARMSRDRRSREPAGAAPDVDIDLDGFESARVVLPPKAGNYAESPARQGQAPVSPSAAHRLRRRQEARSSSSTSRSARRRRSSMMRTAFEVTFDGKKMLVISKKKYRDSSRSSRRRSSTSRWRPPISRCRSIRARNGGRCSWTRTASSATSSTTRTCTAWTGPACAIATASCSRTR